VGDRRHFAALDRRDVRHSAAEIVPTTAAMTTGAMMIAANAIGERS
jgi:hypothetical protein